jgi:hypothetical protein
MKFYIFMGSPRAFKVMAVANHLGLDYELQQLDPTKGEHLSAAYAAVNPNKRIHLPCIPKRIAISSTSIGESMSPGTWTVASRNPSRPFSLRKKFRRNRSASTSAGGIKHSCGNGCTDEICLTLTPTSFGGFERNVSPL